MVPEKLTQCWIYLFFHATSTWPGAEAGTTTPQCHGHSVSIIVLVCVLSDRRATAEAGK